MSCWRCPHQCKHMWRCQENVLINPLLLLSIVLLRSNAPPSSSRLQSSAKYHLHTKIGMSSRATWPLWLGLIYLQTRKTCILISIFVYIVGIVYWKRFRLRPSISSSAGTTPISADCAEKRGVNGSDVVLMMGQSNMSGFGRGYDAAIDGPNDSRIKQWSRGNTTVTAEEPLQHHDYDSRTETLVGMGTAFGRAYVETLPAHRDLLLVPTAHGGTRLAKDGPWSPGNYLFEDAMTRMDAALASGEVGGNCVAAILWHQGESDATANVDQDTYRSVWTDMIETLRDRIPKAARAPVVLGEMAPPWVEAYLEITAPVVAAIRAIPGLVNFTAVASADGLSVNDGNIIHFDAAGQRELGWRYFERLRDAIGNEIGTTGWDSQLI